MLKSTAAAIICFTALVLGLSASAKAGAITIVSPTFDASNQTAPPDTTDYEGIFYDGSSTFPPSSISIGTFNFSSIPTLDILGATISGTFGDENIPVTALTDLFVEGGTIEVGACDLNPDSSYPPCAAGTVDGSLVSWSYTFSPGQIAADFSGGSLDFTAVQNSPFGAVVVGDPTLDIQVSPEPASLFTLAGGLLAFAAFRRRK